MTSVKIIVLSGHMSYGAENRIKLNVDVLVVQYNAGECKTYQCQPCLSHYSVVPCHD